MENMCEKCKQNSATLEYRTNGKELSVWLCEPCGVEFGSFHALYHHFSLLDFIQPERSKRKDTLHSLLYEAQQYSKDFIKDLYDVMRCSEHCGNTVRDK